MVSIDTAKRYRIDSIPEHSKRSKLSVSTDIPNLISIHSSFHSENLSRLKVLFPFRSTEELSKVLEDAQNSFEYAMHLIQKQEREKFLDAIRLKKAQDLVMALSSAKSLNCAVEIAKEFISSHEKVGEEDEVAKENKALNQHIQGLSTENKLLKRAVAKLHGSAKESPDKDRMIEGLRKELETERCKSYSLSIQLNQALKAYCLNPNRELF